MIYRIEDKSLLKIPSSEMTICPENKHAGYSSGNNKYLE